MDGVLLPGHGKELPKDDGLSRSLGPGSDPQWLEICHPTGGGVVTWARTAAFNFQLRSGHPREISLQSQNRLWNRRVVVQINVLIFEAAPKPLNYIFSLALRQFLDRQIHSRHSGG